MLRFLTFSPFSTCIVCMHMTRRVSAVESLDHTAVGLRGKRTKSSGKTFSVNALRCSHCELHNAKSPKSVTWSSIVQKSCNSRLLAQFFPPALAWIFQCSVALSIRESRIRTGFSKAHVGDFRWHQFDIQIPVITGSSNFELQTWRFERNGELQYHWWSFWFETFEWSKGR